MPRAACIAGTQRQPHEVVRLSEAAEYISHGWHLCQFDSGTKGGGSARGWNEPGRGIRNHRAIRPDSGIGLLHVWSGTCALDLDQYDQALAWLAERGIDLTQLLGAEDAVQISSGRPNKGKLLYRVPDGVEPRSLRSVKVMAMDADDAGNHPVLFELRCATDCGTKTVQDVLPPSIHPKTGKPYAWAGLGDWRALPVLPPGLLSLWRELADETPRARHRRGATGPGTSAEFVDFARRLEVAGLKPYRVGTSVRSYCPHHGGESGTSLKVDETAGGGVLWHCKAGCTQEQVSQALADKAPRDRAIPSMPLAEQLQRARDARKAPASSGAVILPAFPDELLALPGGLGDLQAWILGYMSHPSPAAAGIAAIATLSHFAMDRIGVDSRSGLGLNEQFLLLAPTGFGKEDLRKPFEILAEALPKHRPAGAGNLWPGHLAALQFSAPASQQGLHCLLEANRAQSILSDEFAEWLAHSAKDGHRQQAMGHLMQAYTKAYGTLAAPATTTHGNKAASYVPVERPRVLVFATSTAERLLESINASQADSGALNRFVILVAEQERIAKRYGVRPADYQPPRQLVELVAWVSALPEQKLPLEPEAWEFHDAHDAAVIEELAYRDPRLAKRLSEQALKLGALIALGERRLRVTARDLGIAYAIREGLYHRAASLLSYDGALSGMHPTGRAMEQLRLRIESKGFIYRSHLRKESRQFAALSIPEQEAVIRTLVSEGFARIDGGKLVRPEPSP